ncbi:NAD(P)-dependent oxidoreductase [Halostella sp. JP-L12]|uniref:NAD-dependent epimerase/dehydratase family protein n=1 Tax=Halostella TaxID=1843185 RepID=UPI000EF8058A|nr:MULTISPECIES: NAD(P)-dependent oxidoreductase [Halostella]NHN46109.1 NAD(P)-dependent oxidoreductase [Halostella sp. JP-L12]
MTDTALVTGGLGRSGRWIVDRLADDGWSVVCVDLDHPGWEIDPREGVDFRAADLTERAEAYELVAEVVPDAVVHWAALPAPERHAGGRVFETNAMATYNTLVAAGRADARVVWASSESAYGNAFREEPELPEALPLTEDEPLRPEDPYGASKVAGEEIAKTVVRRYGVSVASLRPSWIQYPGEYVCRDREDLGDDRPLSAVDLAAGVGNYWSYVDVRDVVGMVSAALDADLDGHEAFNLAAADSYLGYPTADAVEAFFGDLPDECDLDGEQSALSTAKAADLLGWEPEHDWREAADAEVEGPTLYE